MFNRRTWRPAPTILTHALHPRNPSHWKRAVNSLWVDFTIWGRRGMSRWSDLRLGGGWGGYLWILNLDTLDRDRAATLGPCHGPSLRTVTQLRSDSRYYGRQGVLCELKTMDWSLFLSWHFCRFYLRTTLSDSMYSPLGTILIFLLKLVMVQAKSWWTSSSLSERNSEWN